MASTAAATGEAAPPAPRPSASPPAAPHLADPRSPTAPCARIRALQNASEAERIAYASEAREPGWLAARAREVVAGMDSDRELGAQWAALASAMAEPQRHDEWLRVNAAGCAERLQARPVQPAELLVPELAPHREAASGEMAPSETAPSETASSKAAPSEAAPSEPASSHGALDRCVATPDGAWGLVEELVPRGDGRWAYAAYERQLVWEVEASRCRVIVYAQRTGAVAVYRDVTQYNHYEPRLEHSWDLDGDGVSEAFWHASFYNEGETDRWAVLLTPRSGTLAAWPLPDLGRLVEMKDVSGDGRPDAVFELLVHSTQCGSGFGLEHGTVEIVAEALADGTFSAETPAARRRLRAQCPTAPSRLESPRDVVCARLRGADAAEVRRRLQRQHAPFDCTADVQSPRAHEFYDALLEAAAVPLPVTVR